LFIKLPPQNPWKNSVALEWHDAVILCQANMKSIWGQAKTFKHLFLALIAPALAWGGENHPKRWVKE